MRLRSTTLALMATLSLAACTDRAEPDDLAEQALERWGISGVEADYEDETRVLRLTGTVATADQKQNAEESVRAAVGRAATIRNDIAVRDTRADAPPPAAGATAQQP